MWATASLNYLNIYMKAVMLDVTLLNFGVKTGFSQHFLQKRT